MNALMHRRRSRPVEEPNDDLEMQTAMLIGRLNEVMMQMNSIFSKGDDDE